ncbi:MAG: radical SAM protein [Lachnospiraceae bacterium]|nr:radical SAM protein [Lachnospiraceae bacterium]
MSKILKIHSFETKNNRYIFDGVTSEVIPDSGEILNIIENYYSMTREELLDRKSDKISQEEFERNYKYVSQLIEKGMFYGDDEEKPNLSYDLKQRMIDVNGASYLIVVLTGKCNLRCEYCIYSDKYPKEITYSDDDIDPNAARAAVDQYLELHNSRVNSGFQRSPMIMFYGGEPLMKFDVIKEVVEYAKKKNPDSRFFVTTNGLLLNDEAAEFFAHNRFNVTISLDGYKENHDRNRVTVGRKPTFDTVIKNVLNFQRIKKEANITQLLTFNCCYDKYTDLYKCIKMFEGYYDEFSPFAVYYSAISPFDTTYYEWTKQHMDAGADDKTLEKSNLRIRKEFFEGDAESNQRFRNIAVNLMLSEFSLTVRNKRFTPEYNNACVPCSKIAIYPDGTYALCEKMNKRLPIGNVKTGIDYERTKEVSDMLLKAFSGHCKNCAFRCLCSLCYQYLDEEGNVNKAFCEREKSNLKKRLVDLYEVAEKHPDFMERIKIDDEKFEWISTMG